MDDQNQQSKEPLLVYMVTDTDLRCKALYLKEGWAYEAIGRGIHPSNSIVEKIQVQDMPLGATSEG